MGAKNIKIIEVKKHKNDIKIKKMLSLPTPKNSIEDGDIVNEENLIKEIKKTLRINRIRTKNVFSFIKSSQVIVRELLVPYVPKQSKRELNSMIMFEADYTIPVKLDKYFPQYIISGKTEDGEKIRVLFVAILKKMASGYFSLFKGLGMRPKILDFHANCISKLFETDVLINDVPVDCNIATGVIDFGAETTGINVIKNKELCFARVISSGSMHMDIAIRMELMVSIEEAENIKTTLIDMTPALVYDSDTFEGIVNNIAKEIINEWILNLEQTFAYFNDLGKYGRIEKLYILGNGAKLKGLIQYLETIIKIPCVLIEKVSGIDTGKFIEESEIIGYLSAYCVGFRRCL